MAEQEFRPQRRNDGAMLNKVHAMQQAAGTKIGSEGSGVELSGHIPPELSAMLQKPAGQPIENMPPKMMQQPASKTMQTPVQQPQIQPPLTNHSVGGYNSLLEELIAKAKPHTENYHEVTLPSLGKFYNGHDGPTNGILNIRSMTGREEKILANPKHAKKGRGINMILKNCIMEQQYDPEMLLSIDRTYLIIYLRGISYSNLYQAEIKCPECRNKFESTFDLNQDLSVTLCPEDFGPENLETKLPVTQFTFKYRLPTGRDELALQNHKEHMAKKVENDDDTILYRSALLTREIESIKHLQEIEILLHKLPIKDVSFIRNCTSDPPFGVNTKVHALCPFDQEEFDVEIPFDINFFFPKNPEMKKNPAIDY